MNSLIIPLKEIKRSTESLILSSLQMIILQTVSFRLFMWKEDTVDQKDEQREAEMR